MKIKTDLVVIGGGIFGIYSAYYLANKNKELNITVIESESEIFQKASRINQARVHMGYHYPRSISTALSSIKYFNRFCNEFQFAINSEFQKIYAISSNFSNTDGDMFKLFCKNANIPFKEISPESYFNDSLCTSAYLTTEYSFDYNLIKNFYLEKIKNLKNIDLRLNTCVNKIITSEGNYKVLTNRNIEFIAPNIINATYASTNQILNLLGDKPLKLKYELCEVILCEPNYNLKNIGVTVMDGPFFSIMPFGKTEFHSLTSVEFTPHKSSTNQLPTFECQLKSNGKCSPENLDYCTNCNLRPITNWDNMSQIARKYLKPEFDFKYKKSLYTIKTILADSEIDDSRPTLISNSEKNPKFITVLSGKINTIYDLEEILDEI